MSPRYKVKYLLPFLLFSYFLQGQTDTTRVNPPKPDEPTQQEDQPSTSPTSTTTPTSPTPSTAPTPTNTPQEKNRKRPKGYDDYVKKGKRPDSEMKPFTDNLYYGCNLQLGYYAAYGGSILYYDISPHVGYKFNEFLSGGVQFIYNNQRYTSGLTHINYDIFGLGLFGRALILDRFFLQAEIDALSIPSYFRGSSTTRVASDEKMAGIGYKSPLGEKLSYFFVLLYDFQPGLNSPYLYNPLVYRAGLAWNF